MPLSVLHVHSGNLYGGVETSLATLARERAAAPGMVSSFALCFDGRMASELRGLDHRPHMMGAARISRPQTIWRARQSLRRLLGDSRFDVVVCHQAWPYAIFGPEIRRAGLPLVFWMHTAGDGRHWLERWARRVTPDLAIANSKFTAPILARWFPDARVETIYPAVRLPSSAPPDRRQREQIRQSIDTPLDDLVIVQVGRLEPWKGNREALEALARLRDLRGWTYWIIGGPQRASEERHFRELKSVASRTGIASRVRFVGARNDVPALLGAADIYCQPNTSPEAFGIALVEALGAGLPIVTSALGGAVETVDDTCGLLVLPGNIEALAAALGRLLCEPELRARLGRAARERSATLCDPARSMRRTRDVLSSIGGRRSQFALSAPSALDAPLRP